MGLFSSSKDQIEQIDGVPLYHLELVRDYTIPTRKMDRSAVFETMHKLLDRSPVEQFVVLHLDANDTLLGVEKVSMGNLTMVQTTMAEIFRGAIHAAADAIIV